MLRSYNRLFCLSAESKPEQLKLPVRLYPTTLAEKYNLLSRYSFKITCSSHDLVLKDQNVNDQFLQLLDIPLMDLGALLKPITVTGNSYRHIHAEMLIWIRTDPHLSGFRSNKRKNVKEYNFFLLYWSLVLFRTTVNQIIKFGKYNSLY